jgi:hypothetical protein
LSLSALQGVSTHSLHTHALEATHSTHTPHTVSTHALWRLCTHTLSTLARRLGVSTHSLHTRALEATHSTHCLLTVSTHALWRLCTHTLSTLARSLHTQSPHTLWRLYSLYTHSLSPHALNRGFTLCMRHAQALFGVSQTKFGDGRTFPLGRSSPRPQGKDLSESRERPSPLTGSSIEGPFPWLGRLIDLSVFMHSLATSDLL